MVMLSTKMFLQNEVVAHRERKNGRILIFISGALRAFTHDMGSYFWVYFSTTICLSISLTAWGFFHLYLGACLLVVDMGQPCAFFQDGCFGCNIVLLPGWRRLGTNDLGLEWRCTAGRRALFSVVLLLVVRSNANVSVVGRTTLFLWFEFFFHVMSGSLYVYVLPWAYY